MDPLFVVMASQGWSADRLRFGEEFWPRPQMARNLYKQHERETERSSREDAVHTKP